MDSIFKAQYAHTEVICGTNNNYRPFQERQVLVSVATFKHLVSDKNTTKKLLSLFSK